MFDHSITYEEYIQLAIGALKGGYYSQAEENSKQAMLINPHSPVVHNLYGILGELLAEDNLARKHYRAAYALDPTYKPAIRNLERILAFDYCYNRSPIDFGDQPEKEVESPYVVVYGDNHVGHLCKKEME